ncbi:MAG: DNA gyrase/topoisomerase IV subunit A [Brevinemataceae bacterium]
MDEERINNGVRASYFENELETSYLNYAYSVITGRAIPDARDGLKPVHRRILFSMNELGIHHDKKMRKSAHMVGDVLGKYHPHGDSSVYNAAVRMAQDFSTRYPLIIGQGNFGSIDNDPPAAMRYTELKLSRVSYYILNDLKKDTVEFKSTYDDSNEEPMVLPGMFPQLLCNGTEGIAVGFSTGIPPHNLHEIVSATSAYLDNSDISLEELMKHVQGPDFPTGGKITNRSNIRTIYETGRGSLRLAGTISWEEKSNSLIISEIPYQTIKSRIVTEIVDLVADEKSKYANVLRHVKEVRDESSKEGMRVAIELGKTGDESIASKISSIFYKETRLEINVSVNMVSLKDNRPELMTLKNLVSSFAEHRRIVVDRKHRYERRKAEERLHIVEGLLIAQASIDEVIKTIRSSKEVKQAQESLMKQFLLSEMQAKSILEMRLQRLTSMEVEKLKDERDELNKIIQKLTELLENTLLRDALIKQELKDMADDIGDKRKTTFGGTNAEQIDNEEFLENKPVHLAVSHQGYLFIEVDPSQKTIGRGSKRTGNATGGRKLAEDDLIIASAACNIKDTMLFFSSDGKVFSIKGYEIAGSENGSRVRHVNSIPRLEAMQGNIAAVMFVDEFKNDHFIVFATKFGQGVRIPLNLFGNISRAGVIALKLKPQDSLISAVKTSGSDTLLFVKRKGKGFKLDENLFTPHNRGAMGERAIRVEDEMDCVVGMAVDEPDKTVLFVTQIGRGRRVSSKDFSQLAHRGGKGYKLVALRAGEHISDFAYVSEQESFFVVSKLGQRAVLKASAITNYASQLLIMKIDDELTVLSVVPPEDTDLKESKAITDAQNHGEDSLYT